MRKAVLILDCGATNVKACIVDTIGTTISSHSLPNVTEADPQLPGGLVWNIDDIWNKLAICSRKVCSKAKNTEIVGVTVTTFGVDGTAVKKDGTLCYPVISWQCSRTESIEKNIRKYFDPDWLYATTGLQSYHFNTIHKLIWFRENRPDVLEEMDYYVLMPSLILHRLSGEFITDTTMAGTSMLTENKGRCFSGAILDGLGLNSGKFPRLTEPGTIIGRLQADAARFLEIKAGIPVIVSGHDTQFAILGSGADMNQPVLSSGTWEILMVRADASRLTIPSRNEGVTIEFDSRPGVVNIGMQWVASGVLEWISRLLYRDLEGNPDYEMIIKEAVDIPPGCNGISMIPELFPGGFSGKPAEISGFTHETTRAHIYRAALESLAFYTAYALERLQQAGKYSAKDIICVGGGSRNALWNQIRADVLGIPVRALDMKETTALGAALVAFSALGIYPGPEDAFAVIKNDHQTFNPGKNKDAYRQLYLRFIDRVFKRR